METPGFKPQTPGARRGGGPRFARDARRLTLEPLEPRFLLSGPTDITALFVDLGGGTYQATVAGSVDPGGEVDTYTFSGPAGRRLTVDVASPLSALDGVLTVRDPTGTEIAQNDDRWPGNVDPLVRTVMIAPGTYTLVVEGFDAEDAGAYEVTVTYALPPVLSYNSSGRATVRGQLTAADPVRIYGLGLLPAGTPLTIDIDTATGFPDTLVGLYRTDGQNLVIVDDYGSGYDPYFQTVIRSTAEYFLVVDSYQGERGAFTLRVTRGAPRPFPPPPEQVVFVDTDGRSNTFAGNLSAFSGAAVGFSASETAALLSRMMAVLEAAYAPYNVTFVATQPAGGDYSVIVVTSAARSGILGLAEAIDPLNRDLSQTCVVYGGSFTDAQPATVEEMGTALGNVAAHELGHLLGLYHVAAPSEIMDYTGGLDTLLVPGAFSAANIGYASLLRQGSADILAYVLGPSTFAEAGQPLTYTDANGDLVEVAVNGPGRFFLAGANGLGMRDGQDAVTGWLAGAFDATTVVTFTDLNPSGADDIFVDLISAGGTIGGLAGADLRLGMYLGFSPAAGGPGIAVNWLGGATVTDALQGRMAAGAVGGTVSLLGVAAGGVLDVAGDFVGPLLVNGPVAPGALIHVGGNLGVWTVAGAFGGTAAIDGNLERLTLRRDLAFGASITVGGALADGSVGGVLAGTAAFESITGTFAVQGVTSGLLHVTGASTLSGQVRLTGDLTGTLRVEGDSPGEIRLLDDLETTGRIEVAGSAALVRVRDDLRGVVQVGKHLGRLVVGDLIAASGQVLVVGTLSDADVGGAMRGTMTVGAIDGTVQFGASVRGVLVVSGETSGQVRVARDLAGLVTFMGDVTGSVFIGDDIAFGTVLAFGGDVAEVHVADDAQAGFTVGGNLALLDVGDRMLSTATVDIAGNLGTATIGGRLNGTLTAQRLTGGLTTGSWLAGTFRLLAAEPCAAPITIGRDLRGTLDLPAGHTGVLSIGDDLEATAVLSPGGSLNELHVADKIKTGFTVAGNLALLDVGTSLLAGAAVEVMGDLGTATFGAALNGTLTAGRLTGGLTTGLSLNGAFRLTSTEDCGADITVGANLRGTLDLDGSHNGTISIGNAVTLSGRLLVDGAAETIQVGKQVRGTVWVGEDLATFTVGALGLGDRARVLVGGDLGTGTIGGDQAGELTVAGRVLGGLTVGRHLLAGGVTTLTGGIGAGAALTVGQDVRHALTVGPVLGLVQVGDDLLARLTVTGDLGAESDPPELALSIAGDGVGRIDLQGPVYGAVTVGGRLAYLDSHGSAVPADPGLGPVDYEFLVAGGPKGTLTVAGPIGVVL